ncbi:MAG: nicotinate (nicotinamide) nucleotide adenylyltransferase [Acidobacteriota bacterium]
MKIGLYGGTFDPIHSGHLQPVRDACKELTLDQVIYLPTGVPPHKAGDVLAPAWARFAMVELALLWDRRLVVSPWELREEASYTADTLRHFRALYPDAEITLIIGSDALPGLPTWRDWRSLLDVPVAVLDRGGEERPELDALDPELRQAVEQGKIRFLTNQPVTVSSTELRDLLARGELPRSGQLPRLVLDYIRKYDLYWENDVASRQA